MRAARGLTSDPCPTLDALSNELGYTFAVGIGPMTIVVIGDPEHLRSLFATPTDAFQWGHRLNVLSFFVGDGSMIVSDGDAHRRRRGVVQPAFARRRLDALVPMIVQATDRTVQHEFSGSARQVDLFPIGRRLVLDVVVRALLGRGIGDGANVIDDIERLIEPAKTYLEQSGVRQLPHPFPHSRRSRCRDGRRGLDQIVTAELTRRRADNGTWASNDILDLLLEADGRGGNDPSSESLSDDETRDQVVTLIAAGYDTTASALAWTVLRAASTPGVWKRLRAEADAVLSADAPDAAAMRNLTFASAVVRESLRLHPPGVFAPRRATRDIDLGPYRIKKGSMILWSPYLAGRDPRHWPDAERFDPDRHIDATDAQATAMQAAWVPFGRGARNCIGFALAEMELTLIISRLAQLLDVAVASPTIPPPYGMVVNRPTGGVPVTATRRGDPAR